MNVGGAVFAGVFAYLGVIAVNASAPSRFFIEALFRINDVPGTAVLMIPLVYSIVMILVALLFGLLFAQRFGFDRAISRTLASSFSASVLAAAGAYAVLQFSAPFLLQSTFVGIFTQGLLSGFAGFLLWICFLIVMKSVEYKEISRVVLHRFKKLRF